MVWNIPFSLSSNLFLIYDGFLPFAHLFDEKICCSGVSPMPDFLSRQANDVSEQSQIQKTCEEVLCKLIQSTRQNPVQRGKTISCRSNAIFELSAKDRTSYFAAALIYSVRFVKQSFHRHLLHIRGPQCRVF